MNAERYELVSVAVSQLLGRGAEKIILEDDPRGGRTMIRLDEDSRLWPTERAARYVGVCSIPAFYRWTKKWRVRNRGKGMWAQVDLDKGVERQRLS